MNQQLATTQHTTIKYPPIKCVTSGGHGENIAVIMMYIEIKNGTIDSATIRLLDTL
jgi:hypothetical protein